jgi:serine/threonine protein kinase
MSKQTPKTIGRYEVIQQIGSGGMGAVYKARDPSLDRLVAIKMLGGLLDNSPEFIERFNREARTTALLKSPNIVTTYDTGVEDGNPYLVMELLEGWSLENLIDQHLPPRLSDKLGIMIDVCSGLTSAHQHGVVHRDIKPSNIMVLRDGRAVIVDFGIAAMRGHSRLTVPNQMVGSIQYMSPEQLEGKEIGTGADIFATGVVLYQLLTGALPFDAPDLAATMLRIIHDTPPGLNAYLEQYPPELDHIVSRALAKAPADRYSSASELSNDLSSLQNRLKDAPHSNEQAIAIPTGVPDAPTANEPNSQGEFTRLVDEVNAFPSPQTATISASGVRTEVLAWDAAASKRSAPQHGPPGASTQAFNLPTTPSESEHAQPHVRLTITTSEDRFLIGKSVIISAVPFRIGRKRDADLIINDPHLSQEHAILDWDGRSFTIVDPGSRNGTYVNGKRLDTNPQSLLFGAVIRLGSATVLTFSSDEISELPDLTDQVMANRYKLTSVLHNGSKSALYEAIDTRLSRRVAIKILSPGLASHPKYLENFNREAEAAAHLSHPHLCRIFDYGQATLSLSSPGVSVNFICMELMPGGSLAKLVDNASTIPLSTAVSWLDHISNALDCAHGEGVIHGGLKLSSIVFDGHGQPYLTDFAMASRSSDQATLTFFGSPQFLAPEQWDGLAPTPMTDQYSLAVVAYLLVTGSFPFEGQLDPKVRERNFLRPPVPAHEEAARAGRDPFPPTVSEVLRRALAAKPQNRYSSVRDFFLALQSSVSGPIRGASRKPVVFVSYQRDPSAGWAVLLQRELEQKHDISVFVDTQRMDSAVQFPARLKRAIEECDVFVCLLSGSTLQSRWVQEEIKLAWQNNKPMIPVFQESYSHPSSSEQLEPHIEALINYEGVKLLDRQNVYIENAFQRLANMVAVSVQRVQ